MKPSTILIAALCALTSSTFGATPSSALNLRQMIVPAGKFGRHVEFRMRPSYITIHSTENRNATALQHATGMKNGAFHGRSTPSGSRASTSKPAGRGSCTIR